MNKTIKNIVDTYFEEICYTEKTEDAHKRIEETLNTEYEQKAEESGQLAALDAFLRKYNSFTDIAKAAGYTEDNVKSWQNTDTCVDYDTAKKAFRKQRKLIYFISLFLALTLTYTINIFFQNSVSFAVFTFGYAVACLVIALLIRKKYIKREKELLKDNVYSPKAFEFLRDRKDRYKKRLINGLALTFSIIAIFLFSELCLFLFADSKLSEVRENIFANITLFELVVYISIKNFLCLRWIRKRIPEETDQLYSKQLKIITIAMAVYWVVVIAVTFIMRSMISYYMNFYIGAGVGFAILLLIYNLTFRNKTTYRNLYFNKKRLIAFSMAVIIVAAYNLMQMDTWFTQEYINSVAAIPHEESKIEYDEDTGVYTITMAEDDFKILQLTDIHLGGSLYSYRKDMKALKAVYAEIAYAKPDLVVVTGDLTFPLGIMSLSFNNYAPVMQFASFMRNIDIPWLFTYGNHDTESLASSSKEDLNSLYKSLSWKTSKNLLYPYVQPDIWGRNNQMVKLKNKDGSINQLLFMIDSNAYTGEGINVYDYIHDDQVEWYKRQVEKVCEEEGKPVSSMAFFHIPLQEYRDAYELYEQGSDEVIYYFGVNGEKMINKVCCSDYPSKLFDTMRELGSTKAVFCGHDHYNNMSLGYKGIRLTYGMSIDYLAMPGIENDTAQRGGTLITVHADSSYDIEQLPLTEITK